MQWLIPSVISTLCGVALLTALFWYLHRIYEERHLRVWAWSWSAYALRLAAMLVMVAFGPSRPLLFFNQCMGLLHGVLLLEGTLMFLGHRLEGAWRACTVAGIAYAAVGIYADFSFLWLTLPIFSFLAVANVWTGWVLFRHRREVGLGGRIVGWTFVLWGLHKLDYPWLREVAWFAPWGYLLGAVFAFTIALGTLLMYFEKLRRDAEVNAANYRNIFDAAPYGIAVADSDTGELLDANPALCDMVARAREALVGRPQGILHPQEFRDEEGLTETFKRHINVARGEIASTPLLTANGDVRQVEIKSAPVTRTGRAALLGFFHDVTEQIEAQRQISRRDDMLRALFEAATNIAFILTDAADPDPGIVEFSPGAEKIFGYSREEALGLPLSRLHTEEDAKLFPGVLRHLREGKKGFAGEITMIRRSGQTFPALMTAYPLLDASGGLLSTVEVCVDISRQKETEDRLSRELAVNRTLATLGNALLTPGLGVAETADQVLRCAKELTGSAHGYVGEVDPETRELVIYTFDTMMEDGTCRVGAADQRIAFPPRPDGTYGKLWGHSLNTGEPFYTNAPGTRPESGGLPEGHLSIHRFLSVPVRFGDEVVGQISLANPGRDYTDRDLDVTQRVGHLYALAMHRHRTETERLRLEERMRESQKLEAVGTLAGGIAHDFNNILGAILGYSELALQQAPRGSELADDISEVVQAGQRARELVKQILTFSRRDKRTPEPVQCHLVVGEALRLLRQTIPSNIPISSRLAKQDDLVLSDPTQLHQIVMNLCTNAYHALRSGEGRIEVTLEPVEVDPSLAASVPDLREGPYLRLTVADTGTGMDVSTLARAMEPFFTTKPSGEGTGMGLSVVHGIVRSHEGAVRLESRLGEGTRVSVYLPRHVGEEATPSPRAETEHPGGTERVLVVDDEPALARLLSSMLGKLGYRVESVTTSSRALALVAENPHGFDVVVADQTMPGMTGDVLTRKLLEVRPDLPVVICTGYSESLGPEGARAIGARGFLHKPVSQHTLAVTLRAALDGTAG